MIFCPQNWFNIFCYYANKRRKISSWILSTDWSWQLWTASSGRRVPWEVLTHWCLSSCTVGEQPSTAAPSLLRAGIMALQLRCKDKLAPDSCFSMLLKWQANFHWWFESLSILLILSSSNKESFLLLNTAPKSHSSQRLWPRQVNRWALLPSCPPLPPRAWASEQRQQAEKLRPLLWRCSLFL